MNNMKVTHKMRTTSGGGNTYDGGEWNIKETDKTYTFTLIKKPFFESSLPEVSRIRKEKEKSHSLRDWGDGTFTVYPFQNGTPHYFEPVDNSPTQSPKR